MKREIIIILIIFLLFGCATDDQRQVVVYTSVDQIFSEPILNDFEQETGIKVRAVYDVEASKTVGLINRILAEKDHPQCDVFWNSEVGRTLFLKKQGVLAPYESSSAQDIPSQFKDSEGYWTGFGARARVLVYNTGLLKTSDLPHSIFELTEEKWRGKVALGYPLLGTIATHMAALYAVLGQERTENFLRDLKSNDVAIVDGNSVVRDMVVEGKLPIGFTDTDDVNVAIQAGQPVKMLYPDKDGIGTLLIPNTVAFIKAGPNPAEGKKLIDYLLSREVEQKLAFCESAQMPLRNGVKTPSHVPSLSSITAMKVKYDDIAENIEKSDRFCQSLFIR